MLDVKVLILFVTARANYPMTLQEIYETCYVDDCLSYFDVCTALPQLVESGHIRVLEDERYEITEKGRLAYTEEVARLKQCVEDARAAALERGDMDEWRQ